MFEYHGWATLRDTQDEWSTAGAADDLSKPAYDAVTAAIAGGRLGDLGDEAREGNS
ncbi:hypothetical protein [Kribbella sp. HUAS MG21]|uniref:Uncharacterized protein n=1 Tax=Kribbella sp. HUAS MG21 TaxID=3160966 RepID=A0AAU7T953_9ACTN